MHHVTKTSRMKCVSLLLLLSSALLCSHLDSAHSSGPPSLLSLLDSPLTEHLLRLLHRREPAPTGDASTEEDEVDEEDEEDTERLLSRRNEPPLSIDLTFHLLRNMIHMAKAERQREQALLNRKLLDEVGK